MTVARLSRGLSREQLQLQLLLQLLLQLQLHLQLQLLLLLLLKGWASNPPGCALWGLLVAEGLGLQPSGLCCRCSCSCSCSCCWDD